MSRGFFVGLRPRLNSRDRYAMQKALEIPNPSIQMKGQGRDNYERARDLVMKYGWNTTCFQIVNPGIEYWFGDDGESVVGYVASGRVRVVAGAPVCSEETLGVVTAAFENDSTAKGLGVVYFGAEARLDSLL